MTRVVGARNSPPVVVIAHDERLLYSDNYARGWPAGFKAIGCDVRVIDIGFLRQYVRVGNRLAPTSMRQVLNPKMLAQKVVEAKPDLVWFHHGRSGSEITFQNVLRAAGLRTACYLCDEPYETGETSIYSQEFDHVFTMDPCTVEVHRLSRKERNNVWYLPPAADTPFFRKTKAFADRRIPAYFLGNGTLTPRPDFLEPVSRLVEGAEIHYMTTTSKHDTRRWVGLDKHPEKFNDVKIGLNVHRDPSTDERCWNERIQNRSKHVAVTPAGLSVATKRPARWGTGFWNDGNLPASHWAPRFMDMSACGVCVINDDSRSEIEREFDWSPQASDPDHFAELVMYYLEHQSEAAQIGEACAYRISRRHTYAPRAAEILIRVGLGESLRAETLSSLGAPEDFLTPQGLRLLGEKSSLGRTGRSEKWDPQFGSASMHRFSKRSVNTSLRPDPEL